MMPTDSILLDIATWMGGLPFAELGGFVVPVLCAILGAGGVWALLSARTAATATERAAASAAKATERAAEAAANATERAAEAAATPAIQMATTADWHALMSFWQAEMNALRTDANKLEVRVMFLERQREEDLQHITDLEMHIWNRLPPPPPARRKYPPPDTGPA
jgi:hypothetical protein